MTARMCHANTDVCIQFVSAGEALLLVVVSAFQVMYLKSLFNKDSGRR